MTVDYRAMLQSAAESTLAEFNSKLVPGKERILGVRMPVIRRIARDIIDDDWRQIADSSPEYLEEEILKGIVIATAPISIEERISASEGFIPTIDNWSVCDSFSCSWRFDIDESRKAWDFLSSYMASGKEFEMRTSVVSRMWLFKDKASCRSLLGDLASFDNPGYYYRMGSAWAVATVFSEYPDMAEELLSSNRLEPWTHNKAIQKIGESLKTSKEDRARLRLLKRQVRALRFVYYRCSHCKPHDKRFSRICEEHQGGPPRSLRKDGKPPHTPHPRH